MARIFIILAGGSGTRFWPASTKDHPKQFARFFGDKSMLELAVDRVKNLAPPEHIYVVTSAEHVNKVTMLPKENVIGEPCQRDTAPAVGLALSLISSSGRITAEGATVGVLTADHLIEPVCEFEKAMSHAMAVVEESPNHIYTFGIRPTHPSSQYGYLRPGRSLKRTFGLLHHELMFFEEKPDLYHAAALIKDGCFWNSGMYVFNSQHMLGIMDKYIPEIRDVTNSDPMGLYHGLPKTSFDYGIMEKIVAEDATLRIIEPQFKWTDVGTWETVEELYPEDHFGNRARGVLFSKDSGSNFVFCDDEKETVALLGVENLCVIRAENKTLVVRRSHMEKLKEFVLEMERGAPEGGPSSGRT